MRSQNTGKGKLKGLAGTAQAQSALHVQSSAWPGPWPSARVAAFPACLWAVTSWRVRAKARISARWRCYQHRHGRACSRAHWQADGAGAGSPLGAFAPRAFIVARFSQKLGHPHTHIPVSPNALPTSGLSWPGLSLNCLQNLSLQNLSHPL